MKDPIEEFKQEIKDRSDQGVVNTTEVLLLFEDTAKRIYSCAIEDAANKVNKTPLSVDKGQCFLNIKEAILTLKKP